MLSGKEITINSSPRGAKLYIDNVYKGTTPYTTELSFGKYQVKLTQDEYEDLTQTINITQSTDNIKLDMKSLTKDIPGMVFVKGGCFTMGCTSEQSNCNDDEKPTHRVCLDDFYIGKYEVNQKQWKEIMGNNPSYNKCDDCPVEKVSWNDVQEFIKKLNQKTGHNYRLPTEAEWEYAARGGQQSNGYKYSGSNNLDEVGWYWKNSGDDYLSGDWDWDKIKKNHCKTHKVGQKKANELGIYDMSGNVWEWCSDWYGSDYYKSSPERDPQGPFNGRNRVNRGGGRDLPGIAVLRIAAGASRAAAATTWVFVLPAVLTDIPSVFMSKTSHAVIVSSPVRYEPARNKNSMASKNISPQLYTESYKKCKAFFC